MALFDESPLYQLLKYENAGLTRFFRDATANGLGVPIETDVINQENRTVGPSPVRGYFFLNIYDPLSNSLSYVPTSLSKPNENFLGGIRSLWHLLQPNLVVSPEDQQHHMLLPFLSGPIEQNDYLTFTWQNLLELYSLQKLPPQRPSDFPDVKLRVQTALELIILSHQLREAFEFEWMIKHLNPLTDKKQAFAETIKKFKTKISEKFVSREFQIQMPGTLLGGLTVVLPNEFKTGTESDSKFDESINTRLEILKGSLRLFQSMRAASFLKTSTSNIPDDRLANAVYCVFGRRPIASGTQIFEMQVEGKKRSVSVDVPSELITEPYTSSVEIDAYKELCAWQIVTAANISIQPKPSLQKILQKWLDKNTVNLADKNIIKNNDNDQHLEVAFIFATLILHLINLRSLLDEKIPKTVFVINFSGKSISPEKLEIETNFELTINAKPWGFGAKHYVHFQHSKLTLGLVDAADTSTFTYTVTQENKLRQINKSATQLISLIDSPLNKSFRNTSFFEALKSAGFELKKLKKFLIVIYPENGKSSDCKVVTF